jgi:hypothetical protein
MMIDGLAEANPLNFKARANRMTDIESKPSSKMLENGRISLEDMWKTSAKTLATFASASWSSVRELDPVLLEFCRSSAEREAYNSLSLLPSTLLFADRGRLDIGIM